MTNSSEGDALESLRKEVTDLKEVIKLSDGLRRDIRSTAEQLILESPLVTWGKWLLGAVITLGLAVWLGGAIYGGFQIKSLRDQYRADLQEIRDELKTKTALMEGAIKETREELKRKTDGVEKAVNDALSDIGKQRERAQQKLAVDALPDLAKLKGEISALEESGRRLDLKALSALSHWSVVTLFGLAAVAFLASMVGLFQARRSRIRRMARG